MVVGDKVWTDGLGALGHKEPVKRGVVKHIGSTIQTNLQGIKYRWISVDFGNYRQIWPSHRLKG